MGRTIGRITNRRAEALTMVVGFVLLTVCILVAVMFFLKWKSAVADTEDTAPCATAIKAHSVAISLSKQASDAANLPIVCPTKIVSLSTKDEDKVKETLAKEMKNCWSMWGQGKNKLFTQDGVYCHVCSIVRVNGVDNVTGFTTYLDTHTVAKGQSYTDYLSGAKTGSYFNKTDFPGIDSSTMPVNQTAIIFYHANGKKAIDKVWNSVFGNVPAVATTGAVIGAVAGIAIGIALAPATGGTVTVILIATAAGTLGAGIGGVTAAAAAYKARIESDYMSIVVIKPLREEELTSMECKYAPVRNT